MTFRDGDWAFYLLVAVGESASDETRNEVLAILHSLRFDERTQATG